MLVFNDFNDEPHNDKVPTLL